MWIVEQHQVRNHKNVGGTEAVFAGPSVSRLLRSIPTKARESRNARECFFGGGTVDDANPARPHIQMPVCLSLSLCVDIYTYRYPLRMYIYIYIHMYTLHTHAFVG